VKTYYSTNETEKCFPNGSVVTLGNFDGIHLGHQELLKKLIEVSKQKKLPSIVITYSPNPAIVLGKNPNQKLIYTEDKKIKILQSLEIDNLLIIHFTNEFSTMLALDFLKNFLISNLNAKHIIIGHNHCFGKGREGDFPFLEKYSSEFGYSVEMIEQVVLAEDKISSSYLRNLISDGDVIRASKLLGRDFSIIGKIVEGDRRGTQIGFPTANILSNPETIIPGNGVYSGYAVIDGKKFPSMINIGVKPTFGENSLSIESHLLGFSGNIYGKEIEQTFVEKLRNEKRFSSVNELIEQLKQDKINTENSLAVHLTQ
jgi:riboflavin kinase/FMN adenylyltransferase